MAAQKHEAPGVSRTPGARGFSHPAPLTGREGGRSGHFASARALSMTLRNFEKGCAPLMK